MSTFKFLTNNDFVLRFAYEPAHRLYITNQNFRHINNEYCFQFDDEEPFVFATGSNDLTLRLTSTMDTSISFAHNGRTFRLFAREAEV